jgi:alpha-tubulin suppressor-like RCC1 family protein
LVTAVGNGAATITAVTAGVSGTASLAVSQVVATVEVTPRADTLSAIGDTRQFSALVKDMLGSTVEDVEVLWVSSNQSVATVDTAGLATAIGPGETVITVVASGVRRHAVLAVELFAAVTTGQQHTCGLMTSGSAYCWGYNAFGQLGDGTMIDRITPVAVSGGLTFEAVSAGSWHTCGVTTSGSAYCWGRNAGGQLGDGTTTDRYDPVAVVGGLGFVAADAGVNDTPSSHTCGLTTGGSARCWGRNDYGQLGDGTKISRTTPVTVSGGLTFEAVSAGRHHTCGVTSSGTAYCWGRNRFRQLGDSTSSDRTAPVAVSGGLTFETVSAGFYHTCGVTSIGSAYCWGHNEVGELGDGNGGPMTYRATPVAVSGGITFEAVSAGKQHTCGVTSSGSAYCWGWNFYGQVGDGTTIDRSTPVAVSGGLTFEAVSAAQWGHACGVTSRGSAYCWGNNAFGQLGDGTTDFSYTPVRVSFP